MGKIIEQTPGADTPAKKGTAIDLVVSRGPDLVVVPGIAGLTQAAADAIINLLGEN